ncbi:MAG: secretin N-terminal domain-containing protein [Candidatus Omnitrophota bacterium]
MSTHKKLSVGIIFVLIFGLVVFQLPVEAQPLAVANPGKIDNISLDIKGMDILDVFRILSMRGGLNIISGKNVTGKVTLFLKDVAVWDAFEIIIAANALAYEKRGNIIYVMTERDYELSYGQKYEDKRIVKSFKLQHVKAVDIIKAVSQLKTNIGKVIDDETSETVVLMDIPDAVADMSKVIEGLDIPLATKVYALQYASAESVKDKLAEMLTPNVGSIRIDERTNKVVITDLEERIHAFDNIVTAFDEKHKEVLIEAKILQITLNDDYKMGINWDAIFTKVSSELHHIGTIGVNLKYANQSAVIPTTASTAVDGGAFQIGQLDEEGYQVVIQALKEYGVTNILSSPRIVALNNEEAKILVGTNQPYATRSISQTSGGASNIEAENVTFLDLGVKLYVTPTINADNYITMKIKPEVSSTVSDYTIQSSGNTIPVVKTTTTETTVMIKDGSTVLIGGLLEDNIEQTLKAVPGLSDIPFLGNIFKSRSYGSGDSTPEKTELVIFLTPHIITGDDDDLDLLTTADLAQEDELEDVQDESYQKEKWEKQVYEEQTKEYYNKISSRISEVLDVYSPPYSVYGEVIVGFVLSSRGELLSEPTISRTDNELISDIGKDIVKAAAPFPIFPSAMDVEKEFFEVAISYEKE